MMSAAQQTVFVGLSGGVDSSTTAHLLKEAGHRVVGVYMKNWSADIGGYRCPWREDYLAAKNLAAFLGIEFKLFDFQTQYKQLVVDYMLEEYKRGKTPNPDIRCNEAVKFDLFLKACLEAGAEMVATGHYAKVEGGRLLKAADKIKDQTYFLYRIDPAVLDRVIFPLGDYLKPQIRQLATAAGLPNAARPDSMGLCFVGQVGLADFLKQYVETEPGEIVDTDKQGVVGRHEGAIFYTLGQRQGLNVGGGLPYYVVGKDMENNEVYVSRNLRHPKLWTTTIKLRNTHWLVTPQVSHSYSLRIRHGAELVSATLTAQGLGAGAAIVELSEAVRGVTAGQSAVFYDGEVVVGGGIMC